MKILHPRKLYNNLRNRYKVVKRAIEFLFSIFYIEVWFGDFWTFREHMLQKKQSSDKEIRYYWNYLEAKNAFVGLHTKILGTPITPHGLCGIFISESAIIGEGVTIFQHVIIGSNMLCDSKCYGAPKVGHNVVIGAGAILCGNITVGDNCRVGAGTVVYKDIPANSTVVSKNLSIISHGDNIRNNIFVSNKVEI